MSPNPMLNIISGDLELSPDIQEYVNDKWGLKDAGHEYNLIAIFGAQSTGKSTLLNTVFGTGFDVMTANRRQQTTKGLWMTTSGTAENTIVMDVEGTDSRERGEDLEMERKSALFSLAISQVLLINLLETDIGRSNASNYGLLRTVFEVNLGLFQSTSAQKTLLLFVIRDHYGTPVAELSKTLEEDMNQIWEGIRKPEGLEDAKLSQYFDLAFTALPHKLIQAAEFDAAVEKLKPWFSDPDNPNYVFKKEYRKRIPSDGLGHFAGEVWEQICSNKDLDLPTQRQLLAKFRCDEISRNILHSINDEVQELQTALEGGREVADLADRMHTIYQTSFDSFCHQASRYETSVFQTERDVFAQTLHGILYMLFAAQLRNIHRSSLKSFTAFVEKLNAENPDSFSTEALKQKEHLLATFENSARSLTIPGSPWKYEEQVKPFSADINAVFEKLRAAGIKNKEVALQEEISTKLEADLAFAFNTIDAQFWPGMDTLVTEAAAKLPEAIDTHLKGYQLSEDERADVQSTLSASIKDLITKELNELVDASTFNSKLRTIFHSKFRFDSQRRPIIWRPGMNVETYFDSGKLLARNALEAMRFIKLDWSPLGISNPPTPLALIDKKLENKIWTQFESEVAVEFQDASMRCDQPQYKIPKWTYLAIFLLGFNELMDFISSPGKYLLIAVFLGLLYVVILAFDLQVPVENFIYRVRVFAGRLSSAIVRGAVTGTMPNFNDVMQMLNDNKNDRGTAGSGAASAGGSPPAAGAGPKED
ncbi:hypothetical protein H696_06049 [Fonticula alba]|uniref:Protein SEY1 homolog n=1 Tax=Fonticula alba TaxID=691883 RepID=A0A058Z096_FONAL|nr:hypothetical protein H696_06049 [Fonticula alba]KCV67531.1 hypothetical protein H696_06049 [Fonticula alba]|eukprot:XP_009498092.1 hypothetical protein H696_06049 [Fonticula alba]